MQGRMPFLAEAQIRPGVQYPYPLHTESCNARGGGTRRLVPKSQVERCFQEAWYEIPPKPMARARAHRGVVPLVLCISPRAVSPTQDTPVRGAQIQVRGGQDQCRALFGPRCPAPQAFPRGTLSRSTSVPGGGGECNPAPRSPPAGLSSRGPGGPASSSRPFGPITIR